MNQEAINEFRVFPEQASTLAPHMDVFYLFMVALTTFFCIVIPAAILYFSIKYRRRPGNEEARRVPTSTALELTWTIIPFFIVIFIFFWGSRLYFMHANDDPNALEILTTGKKWMWKFQHKNGRREINDLHIPVNTPVRLKMASEDVIHSMFIPDFRAKQDVMPGRFTYFNFEATKPGVYHLFCNQYCGTDHSRMIGKVYVMEEADYQKWLGGYSGETPEQVGEALFTSLACITCHSGDSSMRGPVLNGIFGSQVALEGGSVVEIDDDYLRESILNPEAKIVAGYQPLMPSFKGMVTQEQVNALIAYIKSMPTSKAAPEAAAPAAPVAQINEQSATEAVTNDNDAVSTAGETLNSEPAVPAHAATDDQQGVQ